MDLSILCLIPLVLIVSFPSGEAVQCYVCNSADLYDKKPCADITSETKSTDFVKNCTELGQKDNLDYKRCRVVWQDVDGDIRIVRSCATWPESSTNRCIDRTGTSKIKVRYCECDGNLCNGSLRLYGAVSFLLATVVGLFFAKFLSR